MSKEKQSEEKQLGLTRRDFLKGIAVGAVATAAVSAGVVAVSWPAAPPAPPGVVTKTETVTRTTTAAATTVTATTTAPPVTTTVTAPAPPPPAPPPAYTKFVKLNVNGATYEVEVENRRTLLNVLREELLLTGAKKACDVGQCGNCTVLVDGKPALSCLVLAVEMEGKKILTIEGLSDPVTGKLHPIQQAFVDNFGVQCGFCIPGWIMTTQALLEKNPNPTLEEAKEKLAGNLCRCGNYVKQIESVMAAAKMMR